LSTYLPPHQSRQPILPSAEILTQRIQAIRRKATTETQDAKEELQRKEQIKEAAKKRQEKLDDLEAKRRAKAKIEADREERRKKAEADKAAREGRSASGPAGAAAAAAAASAPAPAAARPAVNHSEARLRLQTDSGSIMKTFPAETTLFEVAQVVGQESGKTVTSFTMTFPRKTFEGQVDFSKTLREAGLTPNAVLVVK
jgi:TolA-binding protein